MPNCIWITPTGRACTHQSTLNSTYCAHHEMRRQQQNKINLECVELTCSKKKANGLQRCRTHHMARYATPMIEQRFEISLVTQPWWPALEQYIEGRIQMGIRNALKNIHIK